MKKIVLAAMATAATLALTACGSATDASEDAVADNVEMPADAAMEGAPTPVADEGATVDEVEADAMDAADAAEDMVADDAATEAPAGDEAAEAAAE